MIYISCENDCLTEQTTGQLLPLRSTDSDFEEKTDEGLRRQSSIFNAVHAEATPGVLTSKAWGQLCSGKPQGRVDVTPRFSRPSSVSQKYLADKGGGLLPPGLFGTVLSSVLNKGLLCWTEAAGPTLLVLLLVFISLIHFSNLWSCCAALWRVAVGRGTVGTCRHGQDSCTSCMDWGLVTPEARMPYL